MSKPIETSAVSAVDLERAKQHLSSLQLKLHLPDFDADPVYVEIPVSDVSSDAIFTLLRQAAGKSKKAGFGELKDGSIPVTEELFNKLQQNIQGRGRANW